MKTLILNGSPREQGDTIALIENIIQGLRENIILLMPTGVIFHLVLIVVIVGK